MLPRLSALASDPWWETQAQLSALYCVLLSTASAGAADAPRVLSLLLAALGGSSPSALSVALSSASPLLAKYAQPLLPPFVRGLAALPRPQRAALFAQADATVPVPAASSLEFELKPLAGRWPALSVCTELISGDLYELRRALMPVPSPGAPPGAPLRAGAGCVGA